MLIITKIMGRYAVMPWCSCNISNSITGSVFFILLCFCVVYIFATRVCFLNLSSNLTASLCRCYNPERYHFRAYLLSTCSGRVRGGSSHVCVFIITLCVVIFLSWHRRLYKYIALYLEKDKTMDSRNCTESKTLKVGDMAPDFTLKTADRKDWRLSDFRGQKNVVLAFVPFAFSGVCSTQLPSYESDIQRFKDLDTEVVSISMDSAYALNAWAKSMNVSFPLLSDFYPQGQVVDLYGVRNPAGMAERALFVIDKEGITRYIEIMHTPGEMPDNVNLFNALRELA
jgi:peroxiredoxin